MKVIIAGGRDFDDQSALNSVCNRIDRECEFSEVVSGKNKQWDRKRKIWTGADLYGERWAEDKGIPIVPFPADWKKHGKAAGPIRNRKMAEYADAVILFPGGKGTASMRALAKEYGLKILYDAREK